MSKKSASKKPYTRKGVKSSSRSSRPPQSKNENGSDVETIKPTIQTNKEKTTQTIKLNNQSNQEPEKHIVEEPTGSKTTKQIPESKTTRNRHGLIALGLIGGTIVIGLIATFLGGKLDETYLKPPVFPPDWLFPVVWTVLYISIGIASYIAFLCVGDEKKRKWDVAWYGIHLFFNFLWPFFYFTLNWLIFSCVWLGLVVATAIIVTYRYYRANLASGITFTCYTLWLIYAMYLSLGITILNV